MPQGVESGQGHRRDQENAGGTPDLSGIVTRYEALIASRELRPDSRQRAAVNRLARVQAEVEQPVSRGLLARLFGSERPRPRGAYLWGGVGRGKSMLMDLFHQTLDIEFKERAHFHAFMQDVHLMMRAWRAEEIGDPIKPVARDIAQDAAVLSFDEMIVNNSADAMIMSRLFTALMEEGTTLVITSNRPPRDLYKDGLNREHFLPFVDLIENELDLVELNGPVDYRMERIGGLDTWHVPLGEASTARVREAFFRLTDFAPEDAANVPTADLELGGGRTLHVPKSLKSVAVFSFKRLCGEPRGASDYLAIARAYHAIIVVGIPQMDRDMRNEASRFVTLIDALYEHRVKLFATAAIEPEALYPAGDGAFEFKRTVSRLKEMQSAEYMALGHGQGG